MNNLFSRPVLDIAWSSNGLQLMACSLDGTVAYFEFTEVELGRPLSVEEKVSLNLMFVKKKIYKVWTANTLCFSRINYFVLIKLLSLFLITNLLEFFFSTVHTLLYVIKCLPSVLRYRWDMVYEWRKIVLKHFYTPCLIFVIATNQWVNINW